MTPRSIRRAAERKAAKAARKGEKCLASQIPPSVPANESLDRCPSQTPSSELHWETRHPLSEALCYNPEPDDEVPSEPLVFKRAPLSEIQLAANRANAKLSCGPTSPDGKTTSSLNAVKTALTGRTVLLPSDDAAEYEQHLRAFADDFRPVGARESDLVQSIADTIWRLRRIPCLESAIFAQGYIEFAESFKEHPAELRPSMIELQTFIKYEKQLRNLQIQEARLARRREKEMAELRQLQQERKSREQEALETVSSLYLIAKEANLPFEPVADGFVFSIAQIEQHLNRRQLRNMSRFSPDRTTSQAA